MFSQVGVGTTTPQEQLHVSGATNATIRIDGLNSTNNPLNNGSSTHVAVNQDGNLILAPIESASLLINETDFLTSTLVIDFTAAQGSNTSTLYQFDLNISKAGLYYISASPSVIISEGNGSQPDDNIMRGVQIKLLNGGVVLDRELIIHQNSNFSYSINGSYFPKVSSYVYLNPGIHTIKLTSLAFSGEATRVEYGFFNDVVQVVKF